MLDFFYSQLFCTPAYPTTSFQGQTIIVTGSNVGLGSEAVKHFTRLNAKKVIMAVRNVQAGEEMKAKIEAEIKRTGVLEVWQLDLADYESVKRFAQRATSELDRLDVLTENAGIAANTFRLAEGDESTLTVNVNSTVLLALLMLPKLEESAQKYGIKPTLTIVTSEVHAWPKFKERNAESIYDALNDEKATNFAERYPTSKLLEVLTVRHIAPMIAASKNKDVTLNMLNPGLCHSSLARDSTSIVLKVMKALLARTTEVGSRTLVAAASVGPQSHGKYMSDAVIKDHQVVGWVQKDEGAQVGKKLWYELSTKLDRISPGVLDNLR